MKSLVITILFYVLILDSSGNNGAFPFIAKWHFQEHLEGKSYKDKKWMNATVPGSVYSDLAQAGKLDNEIFLLDETTIRWVEDASWVYETEAFDVSQEVYSRRNIILRFNGLDTYARVILNDKEIVVANNAHRSWQVDVKSILRPKGNVLRIIFGSVMKQAQSELNSLAYALAGDSLRAVVRKPQFQFGWDWAPRLLGCGISKTIEWVTFDMATLSDCYIEQIEVNESIARLNMHFTGLAVTSGIIKTEVECLYNGKRWSTSMSVQDSVWGSKMDVNISNPMLWWSNGMGAPNMTEFHCKIYFNDNIIYDDVVRTGLRSIKLTQATDSRGSSFGFELNGTSVFAKGANYVPLNYFIAKVKRDDYINFLSRCRDANINMLRVWGGGFYESDDFYQLCDEYGIMVWQDFMFACSMYPANNAFIENIKSEATEQVVRLRNHPCIALWCGNNEVSEGWERWGWKDGLTQANRDSLQVAYDRIFLHLLPLIVSENTQSSYHHSSPLFGRGDVRSQLEGDMHDWGIWHDELPLEELGQRVPRFMSEFGIQSYPSFEVLQMMSAKGFSESDASVMRYQRHPRGFRLMRDYAERWYPGCSELDYRRYAIITQAVQAEGIVNAIIRQRVSQPYCSGTLFWQLNDIWPSFSWSALDFAQNEKLLFKLLQEAYAPQTIATWVENDSLKVFWLSDKVCDRDSAKLFLRLNPPGESIDVIPQDARFFENQPYSCQVQMGVKLIYSQSLEKLMNKNWRGELVDWTLDCALQINGSNDFVCARKFRLAPGSRKLIVPEVTEYPSNEKNSTLKMRRQIFRKL